MSWVRSFARDISIIAKAGVHVVLPTTVIVYGIHVHNIYRVTEK